MLNSLSRCQNKQGSREGGAERGTDICVCVQNGMGNETESNVTDGSSIQGLPWDIKQILVTACCSSHTGYFLLKGATSHHASHCWEAEEKRHFSFNCPQVVKLRENHCFTQKWVNTNSCFHIPAEWSAWPDLTQTVLMALSPPSAEFCSCTSPQNSHLHMPNRPPLSCHIPGKFPLQITIPCKYYKRENMQTHSNLVNQLMQRHWSQECHYWTDTEIGKKCQKSSGGWGKPFLHSHLPKDLGSSEFSLVCNKDTQPQVLNHYLCSLLPATTLSSLVQTRAAALKNYVHLLLQSDFRNSFCALMRSSRKKLNY